MSKVVYKKLSPAQIPFLQWTIEDEIAVLTASKIVGTNVNTYRSVTKQIIEVGQYSIHTSKHLNEIRKKELSRYKDWLKKKEDVRHHLIKLGYKCKRN